MGLGRVEAFSDGVIAVIVTIMVLEIKAPENGDLAALLKLKLPLLNYLLSFVVVAILWVNHRSILGLVRHVDSAVLWWNNALLFWMSLIPFATAYMGQSNAAPLVRGGLWRIACHYGRLFWSFALCHRQAVHGERGDQPPPQATAHQGFHWHRALCFNSSASLRFGSRFVRYFYTDSALLLHTGSVYRGQGIGLTHLLFHNVAFAGGEEKIGFHRMLTRIQIVVAALGRIQLLMISAL